MGEAKTIGIIGGGQLGRMLTLAALPLGFRVIVVNPSPNSPAALVGAHEIIGDLYDPTTLSKLAESADFITIEIEHLNVEVLERLQSLEKLINPAPQTVRLIQDKLKQKEFLNKRGIQVAPFASVTDQADAEAVWQAFGKKMLVKTRYGAYDGRGNMVVASRAELKQALEKFAEQQVYAEQFVPFSKELAVMVARSLAGDIKLYPVAETVHKRNICVEVKVPAQITPAERVRAEKLALKVAGHLEGAGMFGIEMFLTSDGQVLVNEIAPRVHNSGHYTMDACRTSQFEQHIRAITGLPLGSTDLLAPAAVMVNILGERDGPTELFGLEAALSVPHTSVHLYGKSPTKIDRKMGHINATGNSVAEARRRALKARQRIMV